MAPFSFEKASGCACLQKHSPTSRLDSLKVRSHAQNTWSGCPVLEYLGRGFSHVKEKPASGRRTSHPGPAVRPARQIPSSHYDRPGPNRSSWFPISRAQRGRQERQRQRGGSGGGRVPHSPHSIPSLPLV